MYLYKYKHFCTLPTDNRPIKRIYPTKVIGRVLGPVYRHGVDGC